MTALPTDILKAYYLLNETSGNRADSVGGFTLADTNTVGYAAGKNGNCASFDGADYLLADSLSSPAFVDADGQITISCWFNLDASFSGTLYIAGGRYNGSDYAFLVRFEKSLDQIRTYWRKSNATVISDLYPTTLSLGTWYHYAFRVQKNATVWKYSSFVNGTEDIYTATGDFGFMPFGASSRIVLGARETGAGPLLGMVDEFAIWAGALTDDQITYLASGVPGSFYPFSTDEINNPFRRPFLRPFVGAFT